MRSGPWGVTACLGHGWLGSGLGAMVCLGHGWLAKGKGGDCAVAHHVRKKERNEKRNTKYRVLYFWSYRGAPCPMEHSGAYAPR